MFNWFHKKRPEIKKEIYTGAMQQTGFIVGTGRCGTTILASVLNAHSKICIPHELHIIVHRGLHEKYKSGEAERWGADDFIHFIRERCPYHFDQYFDYASHFKSLDYPQKNLSVLLTGLFDHICHATGKSIFMEQTPWYGLHLEVLRSIFPQLKVVHIIRDGRDVATSYARTPWWSKDVQANLERWGRKVLTIHELCKKFPENCVELRYEDLVMNPKAELTKILALFNLEFEEQMLNPEMLVDYFPLFKSDGMKFQSEQFRQWGQEKRSIFFSENIYGWKRKPDDAYFSLTEEIKEALKLFEYDS